MIKELWRPVVGYEGLYEVSSQSRVRSLNYHRTRRCKELKQCINSAGYYIVVLVKDKKKTNFFVHILVARAFPEICGEWFDGCVVHHKDENKLNNLPSNLLVCTQADNCNYGTHNARQRVTKSHFNLIQLTLDGKFVKRWGNACIASEALGIKSYCNIYKAVTGERKSCCGFKWQYA